MRVVVIYPDIQSSRQYVQRMIQLPPESNLAKRLQNRFVFQKNLNNKPTLEIRPGSQFNAIVTQDLVFQKPYAAGK